MNTPATSIYIRPGSTSYAWNYANTSMPSGAGASAVVAVAFNTASSAGQQVARGEFRYSVDGGRNWYAYTLAADREGAWVTAGTLWRFVDKQGNDMVTPGSFTMRLKLADNTTVTATASVVVDNAPVGLVDDRDTMFASMHSGDTVATLAPIDTGSPSGGRWVIEGQSHAGLFAVAHDPSGEAPARIVIAPGAVLPHAGDAASISVHYYDRYQVDTNGAPIAGHGVSQTLSYYVVDGAAPQGPAFGAELALGASSGWETASPALATLDGGFVAVWQGPESAGGGIWAQMRDAAGAVRGAPFAVAPAGGANALGAPAVAALAGGRFVVAYTADDGGIARIGYRIVEANGAAGAQMLADAGAAEASMPAVTALSDGSFAIAWRSGGTIHARQVSEWGALLGEERVTGALGSAYSPSVTALAGGEYAVAWGEINDGNVYAAIGAKPAFVVGGASVAASISTGAPLPHIATLAGGGFVVAWDSYRNEPRGFSSSDIFFQRFDSAGNRVGEVVQANEEGGGGRFDATVAARPDGGFVIAWQSDHGDYDGNGVFGRRFDANGVALDARDIEISQDRAGDQATPDLTALPGGGFAVAWVDTAANGDSHIEARVMPGAGQQGGGAALVPTMVQPATLTGSEGGNVFELTGGDQHVDGQAGVDRVVYHGSRAGFSVAREAGGFAVDDKAGANGHDTLVNIERVGFSDGAVALDLDGAAGQAYRLYQAAFDRTPDLAGLGYWIAQMDKGLTLNEAAAAFSSSREFVDLYGANPSDAQFVDLLYQNVLHRDPESGGFAYWMEALGTHHLARESMLEFFSESAENQAQVIGSIENGIDFLPWN